MKIKSTTLFAIYLLDFVLPQVSKLHKCLQTKKHVISSLVDTTLHTLDDTLLPAANWVLELQDIHEKFTKPSYSYEDIMKFQNEITRPFLLSVKRKYTKSF